MIRYATGNLLESNAQALVNTVNCEGYMGKGIAYQFKQYFPEMNDEYVKQCKSNKLAPGILFCYKTKDKIIINFPTKDKWREKSKKEYIIAGLNELVKVIEQYNIKSIAIPPLGSGNGGLIWSEVKQIILDKLSVVSEDVEILIYEPSHNYNAISKSEPQLSLSALILMQIKFQLDKNHFNKIGLQKTAYFMNVLSHTDYFHFSKAQYGPFDHAIEVISKNIVEYQKYYGNVNTEKAYDILIQKLISQSVQEQLDFYIPFIKEASRFTNHFAKTEQVEGAGTALFIIQKNQSIELNEIVNRFKSWSKDKANRFSEESIVYAVDELEKYGFVENTFCGYQIKPS